MKQTEPDKRDLIRHFLGGVTTYDIRKALGMTRREIGERCGVSLDAVRHWERGVAIPRARALGALLKLADEARGAA